MKEKNVTTLARRIHRTKELARKYKELSTERGWCTRFLLDLYDGDPLGTNNRNLSEYCANLNTRSLRSIQLQALSSFEKLHSVIERKPEKFATIARPLTRKVVAGIWDETDFDDSRYYLMVYAAIQSNVLDYTLMPPLVRTDVSIPLPRVVELESEAFAEKFNLRVKPYAGGVYTV